MAIEDPSPPVGGPGLPSSRPSWRLVLRMVYEQAWGLCVAYLGIGLVFELLRRLGVGVAATVQEFLDGLPLFAIREAGLLEPYLRASAVGSLTPFWNRVLLSSITVGAILLQATLVGAAIATLYTVTRRRPRPPF